MKKLNGFVILLLIHLQLIGQSASELLPLYMAYQKAKLDSFPYFLKKGIPAKTRDCLFEDHTRYFTIYYQFSEKALHLLSYEKDAFVKMNAWMSLAFDLYNQKKYKQSDSCWVEALRIAVKYNFHCEELHNLRVALNNLCFLSGDYNRAMDISVVGYSKAESILDLNRMAHFSNVLGYIHMKQKNLFEAARHFNKYLALARDIHDTLMEGHAIYNLGDLAIVQKKYDLALELFKRSLATYSSFSVHGELFDLKERESYISNKIAETWKLKGNFNQAVFYINIAIQAIPWTKSVNDYDKAAYLINAGDIYNQLHKRDSAIYFLHYGLSIAQKIIHRELMRDAYEQLSSVYAFNKNYDSAFYYQSVFAKLNDSLQNETNQQEIFRREAEMNMEKKLLVQKQELATQKMWRNIMAGAAILFFVIGYLLYNRYRLRQKSHHQMELNQQQKELFNVIVSTQDQERKRIAQDIHDSLGSVLSAAKLKLSALAESSKEKLTHEEQDKYHITLSLLDEASAELRNISHNIMPATLSKLGIVSGLKNLIDNISSDSSLKIDFAAHGFRNRIDEKTEISIYRIVLELINNVVKHAQASKVVVQLIQHPEHINITVEDNGAGFDYKGIIEMKKGIGLGNIASRVEYMNGTLDIDSSADKGTIVIIDIPYKEG